VITLQGQQKLSSEVAAALTKLKRGTKASVDAFTRASSSSSKKEGGGSNNKQADDEAMRVALLGWSEVLGLPPSKLQTSLNLNKTGLVSPSSRPTTSSTATATTSITTTSAVGGDGALLFLGKCRKCGQVGHRAKDCPPPLQGIAGAGAAASRHDDNNGTIDKESAGIAVEHGGKTSIFSRLGPLASGVSSSQEGSSGGVAETAAEENKPNVFSRLGPKSGGGGTSVSSTCNGDDGGAGSGVNEEAGTKTSDMFSRLGPKASASHSSGPPQKVISPTRFQPTSALDAALANLSIGDDAGDDGGDNDDIAKAGTDLESSSSSSGGGGGGGDRGGGGGGGGAGYSYDDLVACLVGCLASEVATAQSENHQQQQQPPSSDGVHGGNGDGDTAATEAGAELLEKLFGSDDDDEGDDAADGSATVKVIVLFNVRCKVLVFLLLRYFFKIFAL
jgi:hypothetical protein